MSRPLTDQESARFDAIRDAPNVALVQTRFDGRETAVIAAITEDEPSGDYNVFPLAVLITDQMFDLLDDPTLEQ